MNVGSIFTASKIRTLRESFEPMLRSMRGGAAVVAPGVGVNVPVGQQLIETFVITLVFSIAMQILESSFTQLKRYQRMAVDMFPLTYDSPQTFPQDPGSGYEILEPSKDERNGTEFSYSSFISVQPDNFTGEKNTFKHVFHKGSKGVFPLMAPGVFFKSDTNTLRVYMNSSMNWNNYVDIANIPLKKWFHLVVMVKGKALDVYINGNLANRHKFNDLPKLNYGGFYVMLPKIINTKSIEGTCEDIRLEEMKRQAAQEAADAAYTVAMSKSVEQSIGAGAVDGAASGARQAVDTRSGAAVGANLLANATSNLNAIMSGGLQGAVQGAIAGAEQNIMSKANAIAADAQARFRNQNITGITSVTQTESDRDLGNIPITVNGRMNGYISRIKYFAFALSYAQIDKLVKEGPNKTMFRPSQQAPTSDAPNIAVGFDVTNFSGPIYTPNSAAFDNNLPGYQTDAWWTSGNQPSGAMESHQTGWGPQ